LVTDSIQAAQRNLRVTIPRTSAVTPELRAWAIGLSRGEELSEAQISALALASAGNDVDVALLRRLGLGPSDARRQLGQLRDLSLLSPRRTRDDAMPFTSDDPAAS
jgi:hypothetical protein